MNDDSVYSVTSWMLPSRSFDYIKEQHFMSQSAVPFKKIKMHYSAWFIIIQLNSSHKFQYTNKGTLYSTRQVTRATHVRYRVCPRVELISKIIIILLIIFLGFIKSKP